MNSPEQDPQIKEQDITISERIGFLATSSCIAAYSGIVLGAEIAMIKAEPALVVLPGIPMTVSVSYLCAVSIRSWKAAFNS
jgi:hypothetical protein